MRPSALVASVVLACLAAAATPAAAKSERTASYSVAQVWPTAVRFLRIDEGLSIVDKDPDAGYVVFELEDKDRSFRGSLEIVAITDAEGRTAVRLIVQIQGRPEYTEAGLLDRMLAKLGREHGDPVEPPADEPAPRKPPATKKK